MATEKIVNIEKTSEMLLIKKKFLTSYSKQNF